MTKATRSKARLIALDGPQCAVGQTIGIHGTDRPWSIGSYASAGCIRMFKGHRRVYDLVDIGTRVKVKGYLPRLNWNRPFVYGTVGLGRAHPGRLRQFGFDAGV